MNSNCLILNHNNSFLIVIIVIDSYIMIEISYFIIDFIFVKYSRYSIMELQMKIAIKEIIIDKVNYYCY